MPFRLFEILGLALIFATLYTTWTSYRLMKEAATRFNKPKALLMAQSPVLAGLWTRFGLKTAMAVFGIILTAVMAALSFASMKILTAFLQWIDPATTEVHGFLLAIGMLTGMLALMTQKNHHARSLLRKGDLWIEGNILCRRLKPVQGTAKAKARRKNN